MPNEIAKIILAASHARLSKVADAVAVEGTINALKCGFQFRTPDWDNTNKTAVFVRGRATPSTISSNPVCVILDESNECDVPSEILADEGLFSVGVFGSKDNYRIVSNWVCYKIDNGCYADGSTPIDPSSTVYEQILEMLENKSNANHTHDERYYTKEESNERFLVKEDIPKEILKVTFSTTDGKTYTADTTYDEIATAINNGQFVYGCIGKTILPYSHTYVISNVPSYQFVYDYTKAGVLIGLLVNPDNTITYSSEKIVAPNPNSLTFTGAISATYDGSKAITVDIPQAEISEEVKQELKDYIDEKIKIVNLNDTNIVNIWEYETGIYIFRSPSYGVVFNVKEGEDDGTVKIGLMVMDSSVTTIINHKSATNLEAWSCTIIGGSSPSMCRTVYTTHILSTSMWEKGVYAFINKPLTNGTNGQVLTYDETAGTGQVKWSDIPEDTTKLDKNLGADNAGKTIIIDDEGNLVATDLPVQKQSDYNQEDSTASDFIKNKPSIIAGDNVTIEKDDTTNTYTITAKDARIPDVTIEDNGKFLTVVDGVWTATTITDASEVAF